MIDLHTHTHYSDGTYSPAELIAEAERVGLSAIALCDHNTVRGLDEFLAAAQGRNIEAVPGIEFSTDYVLPESKTIELHLLALFIRSEHHEAINALVAQMAENKQKSNRALIKELQRHGYDITYDEVCAEANGNVNRAHVAAVMTRKGYTPTIQEAFAMLLNPENGLYQPPARLPVFETIKFIHSIGAVPVLAHPFLPFKDNEAGLRAFLEQAIPCGLVGMETLYATYDEKTTALSRAIAHEYGLCESGGSDFHGERKPDIALGTGKGNLA
ncbi:MAG: PHP domain-containing protein, partial [Clostridia bacterium]|nr:PHP domain-containing protein [Clostridia bacterium]